MDEFRANYLDRKEPMHFKKCQITDKEYEGGAFATVATLTFTAHDTERTVEGVGNGPIDAYLAIPIQTPMLQKVFLIITN